MPDLDAELLVDQVTMLGLVSRDRLREAMADAEDGSPDAVLRMLLRKGWLTSWQIDRLKKGDPSGFFYGEAKALFHLAEGTFARVYRAEHTSSGQALAVKVLRQRFAQLPEAVHRFHKEAEAGMRLRHPNIVQIIDVGQQDNRHFMIMEYVEGMNLRDFLKLRTRMKGHQALPLMIGLAEGLKYSNEQGVTHRDIKGTNILISNSGTAKLVDFGLATIEGDENKQGVKSQRTVDYSAPGADLQEPQGRPPLGHLFPRLRVLPDGDRPAPHGGVREQGHAQEDAGAVLRRDQADRRASVCARRRSVRDHRKDDEDRPEGPLPDDGRGGRGPRAVQGVAPGFRAQAEEAHQREEDEFASIFALPPEPAPVQEEPPPARVVPHRTVLCVEAQDEIQDVLRKTLTKMGYRALLVGDAERAAERFRESPVDAVIFDADGQGADSIEHFLDMHEKAHEDEHQLVALVILGPRQGDLREKLPTDDRIAVLSKPIKMKDVQDAIHRLLPAH